MEIPILNMQGKEVGSMSIDAADLGGEVNPALLKQAFVMYHANLRQGSARTKTRAEVSGSTKKLYKQKGTGNARVGPKRSPTRRGGGHSFAKKKSREEFRLDMPVKMRRKANRNALLSKLLDNEAKIIDNLHMDEPKTRPMKDMLESLGINRSCLLAVRHDNTNVRLSARNLPDVTLANAAQLTCFDLLNHRFLVIAKDDLEAWLSATAGTAKGGKERSSRLIREGARLNPRRPRPKRGANKPSSAKQPANANTPAASAPEGSAA